MKKFIAPGHWFSMMYPQTWQESVDEEGSFLFFNHDVWTGNFRISAFRGESDYGAEAVREELNSHREARRVKVGDLNCAYSAESFVEEGVQYVQHLWITGIRDVAFECSFTARPEDSVKEAEETIASLEIPAPGVKPAAELIPIRMSEVMQIDDAFDYVSHQIKEQLKKDFTGQEEDIAHIQMLIDKGVWGAKNREAWLAVGITLCVILANEVDGVEWLSLIDGNREEPVIRYEDIVIDPMKLVWSKVRAGETIHLTEIYQQLL